MEEYLARVKANSDYLTIYEMAILQTIELRVREKKSLRAEETFFLGYIFGKAEARKDQETINIPLATELGQEIVNGSI